jgi:hypothetical protein
MMHRNLVFAALLTVAMLWADDRVTGKARVMIDFENFPTGPVPDELMVIDGEFRIVDDAGNKRLELLPVPVVDGAILVGNSIKGAGTIRAKIRAEKSRRAFPRFGVAMHGVSGTRLHVVPAQKIIELLHGEAKIGRADFDWGGSGWLNVELTLKAVGATWTADARVWPETAARPEKPSLTATLPAAPGQGKGSVIGTPYANKPIDFDDIEIISER